MSSRFERTASETLYEGKFFSVRRDTFRHEDGEEVQRDLVAHPGAVGIVAHDEEQVWLVRQPREAVGIPDLLELPAGKLDKDGEPPLETAKRELAEEIGKAAADWEPLSVYYSSAGFTDEEVHVFLATGLRKVAEPDAEGEEGIELVTWPIDQIDGLIDGNADAKTLVGLLWLRRAQLNGGTAGT